LKTGRSYCGDGLSHVLDFRINDVAVGEPGSGGKSSTLSLEKPDTVKVRFDVSAYLADARPTPETDAIRSKRLDEKPYWNLERSRIAQGRKVPVELIVNGKPVATREIEADGGLQSLEIPLEIRQSSWVAVRIFPSVHTNPIWVEVAGQPVRASRQSAQWCLEAVDVCWSQKQGNIREAEREAARKAYDQAREVYRKVRAEASAP